MVEQSFTGLQQHLIILFSFNVENILGSLLMILVAGNSMQVWFMEHSRAEPSDYQGTRVLVDHL